SARARAAAGGQRQAAAAAGDASRRRARRGAARPEAAGSAPARGRGGPQASRMRRVRRGPPELPPPSPSARKALGPYARGRLLEKALGQTLTLDVPWDVFSSQRIDDGTLLLLKNLPEGEP